MSTLSTSIQQSQQSLQNPMVTPIIDLSATDRIGKPRYFDDLSKMTGIPEATLRHYVDRGITAGWGERVYLRYILGENKKRQSTIACVNWLKNAQTLKHVQAEESSGVGAGPSTDATERPGEPLPSRPRKRGNKRTRDVKKGLEALGIQ